MKYKVGDRFNNGFNTGTVVSRCTGKYGTSYELVLNAYKMRFPERKLEDLVKSSSWTYIPKASGPIKFKRVAYEV